MKKLLLLLLLIPNLVMANWKLVVQDGIGGSKYVDFEQIHILDGYLYYKVLEDYYEKNFFGDRSEIVYFKGDCNNFRIEARSFETFTGQMGKGKQSTGITAFSKKRMEKVGPNSINGRILKSVCSNAYK